jgi:hypothetical protein
MRINSISLDIEKDDNDEKIYILIKQFCKELVLDYYFDIFLSKSFTTKMLLNSTFESLKAAFKEIDPEHISLLYAKA